jgi:23S rRNA (adenine-N6)-dimethyltransferase
MGIFTVVRRGRASELDARYGRGSDGHHLLRSRSVAAELVRDAGISSTDHVWEIGAGSGRLTAPLAERAGHVVAVERDPILAQGLRRRFGGSPHGRGRRGRCASSALPSEPFRAFGNIPFAVTTPILRGCSTIPGPPLVRADLLIAARGRPQARGRLDRARC